MAFENIRNKLKSKLEGISSIQQVEDYPTEEFNGFPVVVVESARLEADFETTTENKRTYVFILHLMQELRSVGAKKARRILEGVMDDIIETLDQDQLLEGISLPDNETMIISFPVVSEVGENEKYSIARLEVRVVVSFDTNT